MQRNDNQNISISEWNLKPGMEVDGDSLSYQDMMERSMQEERRRQRERAIMEEGRAMWQQKKREQFELEVKEQDEVRLHYNLRPSLKNFFSA